MSTTVIFLWGLEILVGLFVGISVYLAKKGPLWWKNLGWFFVSVGVGVLTFFIVSLVISPVLVGGRQLLEWVQVGNVKAATAKDSTSTSIGNALSGFNLQALLPPSKEVSCPAETPYIIWKNPLRCGDQGMAEITKGQPPGVMVVADQREATLLLLITPEQSSQAFKVTSGVGMKNWVTTVFTFTEAGTYQFQFKN